MATLALQLACTPPSGPPRTSSDFLRRLDLKKLQPLWRGDPTAQADLEQLAADPTVLAGVRGRYSAFFRSLAGTADGCWGLEDVDLAVLTIPTIASRTDADAAVRLVLEDLGHFATKRKARVGDDVLLVLDEFSAVQGGTDQAIHLAERLRDVGVPVVFGAQSPEGLGDERQQWRLLHTIGGGLVLHQLADPGRLVSWPARSGCPSRPGSWMPGGRPARPGSTWKSGPGSTPTRSASSTPARPSSSRAAGPSNLCPPSARAGPGAGGGQRPAGHRHERGRARLCRPGHRRRPTPGGALAAIPARPRPARPGATAGPGRPQRRRPGHRAGGGTGPAGPPAPASCSPSATPSPHRDEAPSPPSSRRASASNPTGTPPPSWTACGLSVAGGWRRRPIFPAVPGPGGPPWAGARWLTVGPLSGAGRPASRPEQRHRTPRQTPAPPAPPGLRGLHAPPCVRPLTRPQVCPRLQPAWPSRTVAQLRAGRGSALPLRCRLGTLHPAGPADLLADRRIAARPLQGQGRSVPPCGPVLPPLRDALRAPLTPPRPARSASSVAPGGRGTAAPPAAKAGDAPCTTSQQPAQHQPPGEQDAPHVSQGGTSHV